MMIGAFIALHNFLEVMLAMHVWHGSCGSDWTIVIHAFEFKKRFGTFRLRRNNVFHYSAQELCELLVFGLHVRTLRMRASCPHPC